MTASTTTRLETPSRRSSPRWRSTTSSCCRASSPTRPATGSGRDVPALPLRRRRLPVGEGRLRLGLAAALARGRRRLRRLRLPGVSGRDEVRRRAAHARRPARPPQPQRPWYRRQALSDPARRGAYGQHRAHSPVDRFGVWLSARALRRTCQLRGQDRRRLRLRLRRTVRPLGARRGRPCHARRRRARAGSEGGPSGSRRSRARFPTRSVESRPRRSTSCSASPCSSTSGSRSRRSSSSAGSPRRGGVCLVNVPSWRGKRFLEFSAFRLGLSPAEEIDDHKTYYDPTRPVAAARAGRLRPARHRVLHAQVRPQHLRRLPRRWLRCRPVRGTTGIATEQSTPTRTRESHSGVPPFMSCCRSSLIRRASSTSAAGLGSWLWPFGACSPRRRSSVSTERGGRCSSTRRKVAGGTFEQRDLRRLVRAPDECFRPGWATACLVFSGGIRARQRSGRDYCGTSGPTWRPTAR